MIANVAATEGLEVSTVHQKMLLSKAKRRCDPRQTHVEAQTNMRAVLKPPIPVPTSKFQTTRG